jgi:asparagine synthase (glutamine-hydrolysing)
MALRLAHRGPDHQDVYLDDRVCLGHTRLSVIDLVSGDQPLFANDGELVLVADGEICNHVELRAGLQARGYHFATRSDCETILYAYMEYGEDFIGRLEGMFAFALYDRAARRLILARDRLGIKPLFLARIPSGWAFASEMKGLLPAIGAAAINPGALGQYLQCGFSSGRNTLLAGVERLLPGEIAVIDEQGDIERRFYWSPLDVQPADFDQEAAAGAFDRLMDAVMTQHRRADVPCGLLLSGGLDSSLLLALLSRAQKEAVRTFSVGFGDAASAASLTLAEQLSQRCGARHTVLHTTAEAMMERLALGVWAADDLINDFAVLPLLLLAETAGRELKVVLSGEGGNEVFAGHRAYQTSWFRRAFGNLLHPGSGGFRAMGQLDGLERRILGPALQVAAQAWRTAFVSAWQASPSRWSALQRMQYVDLAVTLPDLTLVRTDRALMAHGIEGRLPLLDRRVVEFGLSLPDRLKSGGGQGKLFIRRWARDLLPAAQLRAPRRGLQPPLASWFQGKNLDRLERTLAASPAIRAWFQPGAVTDLADLQRRGRPVTRTLAALLQFAIWHRLFIEGDGARPDLCDPIALLA